MIFRKIGDPSTTLSILSKTERIVWIRIRCTLLRGVALAYVTTHVPGFCGRGMPRRRFVWIGGYPLDPWTEPPIVVTRPPSGSSRPVPSRLISYETERDRLITVEFVAQLYRQPLRRVVAAASSSSLAIYDLPFLSTTRFAATRIHSLPGNSSARFWLPRPFLEKLGWMDSPLKYYDLGDQ